MIHGKTKGLLDCLYDDYDANPSVYLRVVVELNDNVYIDYTKNGCKDNGSPCGTANNPWLLLTNQVVTLGDIAEVGDYVKYIPDKNDDGSVKSITLSGNITGHTNGMGKNPIPVDQTITQKDVNWRVLENNGDKVTLISDDITNWYMYIQYTDYISTGGLAINGATGFNNAINILNDVCSTLYSKKGVATARSVNENDLKKYGFTDETTYTESILANTGTNSNTDVKAYPSRLGLSSYVGTNINKAVSWLSKPLDEISTEYVINNPTITLDVGDSKKVILANLKFNQKTGYDSTKATAEYILLHNSNNRGVFYWIPKLLMIKSGKGTSMGLCFVADGAYDYRESYDLKNTYCSGTVACTTLTVSGGNLDQYCFNISKWWWNNDCPNNFGIRAIVELDAGLLVKTFSDSYYDGSTAAKAIRLVY